MIWLLGVDGDHTFHHTARRCREAGLRSRPLNLRAIVERGEWIFPVDEPSIAAELSVDGHAFVLQPSDSFFCRILDLDIISSASRVRRIWPYFAAALCTWLEGTCGLVMNRPSHAKDNGVKPWHQVLLSQAGFAVPAMMVSSDRQQLAAFASSGPTIAKSLSGARSDAREVVAADFADYSPARGPVHLQRMIKGRDVRAHVVGQEVFAVAIDSVAVDYRTAQNNHYRPIQLSQALAAALVASTQQQGLELAGWDFKVDGQGRYWCLECNPMPGYSGYDRHLHLAISAAVLRRLQAADGGDGALASGRCPSAGNAVLA